MSQSDSAVLSIKRSPCPLAASLDYPGDKWILLIIRDMMPGKKQCGEFQQSPENIPGNILADKLKRLQQAGLVARQPYQDKPPRYEYVLTEMGQDLRPVLKAFTEWGRKYIPASCSA